MNYRILAIIILLCSIFGAGMFVGDKHATTKYLPQISTLKASIDASDAMAKEDQRIAKETLNAIKNKATNDIARLNAYHNRVLHAGNQNKAGSEANSDTGNDAATTPAGTGGIDEAYRSQCSLVALRFEMWRDMAIKNQWIVE
jgi:hypothetical protein